MLMEVLRKTEGMSNLQDLEKSQWHLYGQLEELQITNLREHFIWCEKNIPFWQKKGATPPSPVRWQTPMPRAARLCPDPCTSAGSWHSWRC